MANEAVAPVRVELPSGGWWEIETRPRWKVIRSFSAAFSADGNVDLIELIDGLVVAVSIGWSYEDEITKESIGELDMAELGPVFQIVVEKIVPLFEAMAPRPVPSDSS